MKNIKIQKKAFTLVELIVVITILAILGTIAFISLQGNTQDAKNSKVLSDVASISKKISILSTKNTASLSTYLGTSVADNRQADGSIGAGITLTGGTNHDAGNIDFAALEEDGSLFKDSDGNNYIYAYGGDKVFQVAGKVKDSDTGESEAIVVGNFYSKTGDTVTSLIDEAGAATGDVVNKGSVLPY